jgi:beta-xylosidase
MIIPGRSGARRRPIAAALLALATAAALAGCSGRSTDASSDASAPASESAVAAFAIDQDFPDPDVLVTDDGLYAYATNAPGKNVQMARSTDDGGTWDVLTEDAFPELPTWAIEGKTWAPDVSANPDGGFIMFVTVANSDPALQCIAVATSDAPTGPFVAAGSGPIVCPEDEGGAIDAAAFTDDGSRYLLFKNDGNCCGQDTWLQIAPLAEDGLSLTDDPEKLIKQDQAWEDYVIEAPTLVTRDGSYVLFYSANDYGSDKYATGYATADAVTGPYTKADEPFLTTDSSDGAYLGPGGQDVVALPGGEELLAFHSWDEGYIYRGMHVEPLSWDGSTPIFG